MKILNVLLYIFITGKILKAILASNSQEIEMVSFWKTMSSVTRWMWEIETVYQSIKTQSCYVIQ